MEDKELPMLENSTWENNNNNISNDGLLAFLTDKFGDDIPSDEIFGICSKLNWKCKFYINKQQQRKQTGNKRILKYASRPP